MTETSGAVGLARKPKPLGHHSTWSSGEQTRPELAPKELEKPVAELFGIGNTKVEPSNENIAAALQARLDTLNESSPEEGKEFGEWNLEKKKAAYANAIKFAKKEELGATPIPGLEADKSFARVMQ